MRKESVCSQAGQAFGSVCLGFFFFLLHRAADSRPGGGAESVVHSRSPGGAGHSGAVGGLEVSVSCREYTEL